MKISRRTMLISGGLVGGGFLLGILGIGGYVGTFDRRALQRDGLPDGRVKMIAQWITVAPDGTTTLISPHTEMGQGSQTGLLQILLDEMDVDPARVKVELAPASREFTHSDAVAGFILGETEMTGWTKRFVEKTFGRVGVLGNIQFTGGSSAIRFTGWRGLRHAAAAARQMMAEAGAAQLGVPVNEVTTENSTVVHTKSGKTVDYGELAATAAELEVPNDPPYKTASEWKYIGTSYPRIDLPDKVFATAVYGIDYEVPGMRFAAVAPPPIARAKVTGLKNRAEIEKRRGVEAVIVMDDVVAVVADNPWRAEQAARRVEMTYDAPEGGPLDSAKLVEDQRAAIAAGDFDSVHESGDASAELASGDVIEAEYIAPFLAHATMEPLNATIWNEGDIVHVATGIQGPLSARMGVAEALDLPMEKVVMHALTMGGGFGRRNGLSATSINWVIQAAKIHQQVGGAVKLTWSREADMRLSTFRPSDIAKIRAKLGPDGKPVAWHTQTYAAIGAPSEAIPVYDIPHITVETANRDPALPFAYWRSVDASTHAFFIEGFIDELAAAAKVDPVEYRRSLLSKHPRHQRVLDRVAKMSGWPKAPDAAPNSALGVALFKSFGSIVGQVAEVSMDGDTPRVHRVWCVVDCGIAVNPNSVEAQMQGGIYYGLTAALYGEITFDKGQIRQSNFHNYRMVRFADAPRIKVEIHNTPDAQVGGAGEPGTPPIAPAVANAIAALRERPRRLPLSTLT